MSIKRRASVILAALLLALALPTPVQSQTAVPASDTLRLEVRKGQLLQLPSPAKSVFVADPEIADVQVSSPNSVFVLGRRAGSTTLYALGADDNVIVASEIHVTQTLDEVTELLRQEFPDASLRLRSTPGGIIVQGRAFTAETAQSIIELASQFIGDDATVINRIEVAAPAQVNLRVRVAEMSRQVAKELNVNFAGLVEVGDFAFTILTGRQVLDTAGGFLGTASPDVFGTFGLNFANDDVNVTALVDALEEEGLVSILAEPNLTALSGETASFLAGGEFPIPVAQSDDSITIEFKQFGVAVDFNPTVLSPERISVQVRPEVSELTDEGAIEIGDIRVPALSVRRAETTVELGSGQSFAIAGLLQNNTQNVVSKLPGLGDLPILGRLFRSDRFQRDETELVIIVTPFIVQPSSEGPMASPLDGYRPATDLERIFFGKVAREGTTQGSSGPVGGQGVRLLGSAGFTY